MMSAFFQKNRWPLSYALVTLALTYLYTAHSASTPEGLDHFNNIMFIPAACAVIWRLAQFRTFESLLNPLATMPTGKSLEFAIMYPLIIILICALVAQVTGLAVIHWAQLPAAIQGFTLTQLLWAFAFVFGEEYGWRGYLLPALQENVGKFKSSIIVGAVWALWHGPMVYALAVHLGNASPLLLTSVLMTVVFFFSFPFAQAFFMSGSILTTMLMHFIWNWINPVVLGNLYRNRQGLAHGTIFYINGEGLLGAAVAAIACIWFVMKFRKQDLERASALRVSY